MESGAEFVAVDMPQANCFVVHIIAAVAEQEAEAISKRTQAALQAAKKRGTKLGGCRVSAERFAEIAAHARKERTDRVIKQRAELLPAITQIQSRVLSDATTSSLTPEETGVLYHAGCLP
jgi:DNA invertase Pin-like site-specific DNA recombinase